MSTAEMREEGEREVALWARRVIVDPRYQYPGAHGSVEAKLEWLARVSAEDMNVVPLDVVGLVQWDDSPADISVEIADLVLRFPRATTVAEVTEAIIRSIGKTAKFTQETTALLTGHRIGECLWSGDGRLRICVEAAPLHPWYAELNLYADYVKKTIVVLHMWHVIFVPVAWKAEFQRVWEHMLRGQGEAQSIKKVLGRPNDVNCRALRRTIFQRELDAAVTKPDLQQRFVTVLAITYILHKVGPEHWHDQHASPFVRHLARVWRRDLLASPHNVRALDLGACVVGNYDAHSSLCVLVDLLASLHHQLGPDFKALPRNKAHIAAIGILTPRTYQRDV